MSTFERRRSAALLLALAVSAGCATQRNGGDGQAARSVAPAAITGAQLTGRTADEVRHLLGNEDFRRTDGPTERMRYREAACVLELFLYRDTGSSEARVAHIETRDAHLAPVARDPCLAAVKRSRADRAAG